jgi:hypothetical protein
MPPPPTPRNPSPSTGALAACGLAAGSRSIACFSPSRLTRSRSRRRVGDDVFSEKKEVNGGRTVPAGAQRRRWERRQRAGVRSLASNFFRRLSDLIEIFYLPLILIKMKFFFCAQWLETLSGKCFSGWIKRNFD